MIEVIRDADDIEIADAPFVPLDSVGYGGITAGNKATCCECRHQFFPSQMRRTRDGYICEGCREDS